MPRGAEPASLTSHETDRTMGHRRCLRINATSREHRQRGRLGPKRVISNRREGTFGRVK
jgi:hypothetical protein